ncbi:MAG: glycosyltransferase family 39 protein [Chloroflexota bacterium]|nr:glycosyltransferase family 39 protein [Chloroflexota bacterium]
MSLLYLAPRVIGLDQLVTVDERFWLGRSANFYSALANGDFEDTYQHAHPGVTVMWAGTLGFLTTYPEYRDEHPEQILNEHLVHEELQSLGRDPLDLLIAGRVAKVILQTAIFAVGFWMARGVFGAPVASVGGLLVAFDPFLIAHDRLLHIDGMVAVASFASIMALLRYLDSPDHVGYLVLSGGFAALAWLTRAPAILLVGVAGMAFLVLAVRRYRSGGASPGQVITSVAWPVAVWALSALVTTLLAWPALLAAPGMVVDQMSSYILDAAQGGHEAGIFFYGETVRGDPGILYYPIAILWRMTPFVAAGLAIMLVALALRSRTIVPARLRLPIAMLGLFAVLYLAGMSLGAKKFDRYILPIFPALDFIAAVGIVGIGRLLLTFRGRADRMLANAAVFVAVVGQLASAVLAAPYYLQYFNPLVGGTAGGERMLLLGWGEGLDQSADFILDQPDGDNAVVHMSNTYTSLGYFMPTSATVETHAYQTDMESIVQWAEADYYVAYVTQWQRGYYSRPINHLSQFEPVHTVSLNGVEFARTYNLDAFPPPPEMLDGHACSFGYADQLQLVGYNAAGPAGADQASDNDRVLSLYFVSNSQPRERYQIRVYLVLPSTPDEELSRTVTLKPSNQEGMLSQVDVSLNLPDGRTIDDYVIAVTVLDDVTGEPIPATNALSDETLPVAIMRNCD